jgi:DNA polymerase-4
LPVGEKPPKVLADHEFGCDTNDMAALETTLYGLAEKTAGELRRRGRVTRRIAMVLDYSDGVRCVRQAAVRPGTANDFTLFGLARRFLLVPLSRRVRIRHMRLICDRLIFPPSQLELFDADRKENRKRDQLIDAIDEIRRRFGDDAVRMARTPVPGTECFGAKIDVST